MRASTGSQRTLSTVFLSFQGANTACRSVTVCGAVWASRSEASFSAACAPSALPRRSRLQNGRQPSHTHCVYIFCVSFSRSFYSVRVLARACMYDVHNLLLCCCFFTPRKRVASHRKCDPSVRHVSSGRKRRVREKLSFWPFVVVSVFSRPFLWCFWVVHIFWYCLPSPNQHRLSPRFTWPSYPISWVIPRLVVEMQFLRRVRCAWDRACICRDYCFRHCWPCFFFPCTH